MKKKVSTYICDNEDCGVELEGEGLDGAPCPEECGGQLRKLGDKGKKSAVEPLWDDDLGKPTTLWIHKKVLAELKARLKYGETPEEWIVRKLSEEGS